MKKALIISISFSALLLTVLFYFLISEKSPAHINTIHAKQISNEKKSCCVEKNSGEASENSVYQLESEWKTESGEKIMLGDLKGKKQIMAMVFTSCTYACPLIINDMKKIESQIKRNDVNFLLISIDPKHDTPETLLQYARNNKLDMKRWRLLTGDENSISELAAVLGFKYKKEQDGSFSHSNIINLLNETGEVAYQHFGLNQDVEDVLDELKKL